MNDNIDPLTRCLNKQKLEFDLGHELCNSDAERFQESFLCCDLHHFVDYLNLHGIPNGDAALMDVVKLLQGYGKKVYRFAGDEFVVRGLSEPIADANETLPVHIRQCVVNVDLPIEPSRYMSSTSWVMAICNLQWFNLRMINEPINCLASH